MIPSEAFLVVGFHKRLTVGTVYDTALLNATDISALGSIPQIEAIVCYGPPIESQKPQLVHLPDGSHIEPSPGITIHKYPGAKSPYFILPRHADFNSAAAAIAHTRCLTFLKPKLGGPYFDLEAVWEEHTKFEFDNRSVAETMGTMVQEPYVNNVPTVCTSHRPLAFGGSLVLISRLRLLVASDARVCRISIVTTSYGTILRTRDSS